MKQSVLQAFLTISLLFPSVAVNAQQNENDIVENYQQVSFHKQYVEHPQELYLIPDKFKCARKNQWILFNYSS